LPTSIRLNKFLAQCGVASRRHADELIVKGAVRINGRAVRELGTLVNYSDHVEVEGRVVQLPREFTYLMLNKPAGVVTTMRDPQGRRTVAELLPRRAHGVPVGRLDYDTSGVLLITDDGELANRLLHPRYGVEKTYRAAIAGRLSEAQLAKLQHGIPLDGVRTAPAKARVVSAARERSVVDITIHEGRNRQVRRMFEALGYSVTALTRTRFGPLRLGALPGGAVRSLSPRELAALERHRRPPVEFPRSKRNTTRTAVTRGTS
jgi:23S rRNA pseudouridine2605 synthase